jgi:sorting nexin-29
MKSIVDHRCGFLCNRSTTDQIFCIRQILEEIWEYNETLHQIFIDFEKAHDSVRREVLYNILRERGEPVKLVRLIKMCSNEVYTEVIIGKHFSDM